jgi:hypothetical protein
MKFVYTEDALRDLDDILRFMAVHYPAVYRSFEMRLKRPQVRTASRRMGATHHSARSVRAPPLITPLRTLPRVGKINTDGAGKDRNGRKPAVDTASALRPLPTQCRHRSAKSS